MGSWQVLDEVKKQSLILRLQEGSTDANYFSAICILSELLPILKLNIL